MDYQPVLAAKAASQKPAGWPRLNAGALPLGVMVFALLDDFVNLKNLHIQHDGKNPCHREAAATCTYRRTLGTSIEILTTHGRKLTATVNLDTKILLNEVCTSQTHKSEKQFYFNPSDRFLNTKYVIAEFDNHDSLAFDSFAAKATLQYLHWYLIQNWYCITWLE